jgi:predicted DNA-binding transcriptional regulator AlpA
MVASVHTTLKDRLIEAMKKRSVRFPALAKQTGIPKDRMYKWFNENTNPKLEDAVILEKWISGEVEKVPRETQVGVTEGTVLSLSESNRILAEANKTLADAHIILARGNEELIRLARQVVTNWNKPGPVEPENQDQGPVMTSAEKELLRTGRTGPFEIPKKHKPAGNSSEKGK